MTADGPLRSTTTDSSRDTDVGLSVILPVYNEAAAITGVVEELLNVLDDIEERYTSVEVVIVDDGSSDGTRERLRSLAENHGNVVVVALRRNFGKSAALAAGVDDATGEYIVTMDGDGQDDPGEIPTLLAKLHEGYDCVSGWRKDRQDPLLKRIPSKIQTWAAWLTGPKIHDFVSGLKAYRTDPLREISLYGESHRYIPAMLHRRGFRITEIPVNHREREHGHTKYGVGRLIKGSLDLLFHAFWNQFSFRPIHFIGTIGGAVFGVGVLIGLYLLFLKVAFGALLANYVPSLLLSVALILFGVQLVTVGIVSEMLAKIYNQYDKPYHVEERIGGRD